jgi:hypothetical protein
MSKLTTRKLYPGTGTVPYLLFNGRIQVWIRNDFWRSGFEKLKPPCLGLLGQQARESLLLCVSLCSKSPALEQYIAHQSNFCTILATGTRPYILSPLTIILCSVEDPGCLSRLPDPEFWPSRTQKQQQKRGVNKICYPTFFCSHKFHKIVNYLFLDWRRKKFGPV